MVGDNLLRQGVLRRKRAKLDQQALAQVPRRHAQRVKLLNQRQRRFDVLQLVAAGLRNLFQAGGQVAVLIQVPDDGMPPRARRRNRWKGSIAIPDGRPGKRGCERKFSKEGFSMTSAAGDR